MEKKIRVGAVSYLNTKPLLWGLAHSKLNEVVELSLDYPSNLVTLLKSDKIDVGLVPVAALLEMDEYHIISDYCIGADGEVASVAIFSEVPLHEIKHVHLDYQSRTSVMLCRILFKYHWKQNVSFVHAEDESYLDCIKGDTAAVIIGDRAMQYKQKSAYCFDLGAAWKEMTGLPFVFAAWVSHRKLEQSFIEDFNKMNKYGLKNLEKVIAGLGAVPYDVEYYYRYNISYELNDEKKKGLELFFEKIHSLQSV